MFVLFHFCYFLEVFWRHLGNWLLLCFCLLTWLHYFSREFYIFRIHPFSIYYYLKVSFWIKVWTVLIFQFFFHFLLKHLYHIIKHFIQYLAAHPSKHRIKRILF